MKKVPGKYFWLLMTITGALMFGAPALVSASEGAASTDTENSAADNAVDIPDDDTIAKTTDSAEKNSQETDHSGEGQISKPKYLENAENNGEEIISDEDPTDNTYGYYTIMGGTTVSAQMEEQDLGIQLVNITIQDSEPPTQEVMKAFKAVETAKQGKETALNNANKYRNEKLPEAEAEADQIIQDAEAQKQVRINEAEAEVARFNAMYEEYVKNPEITKKRMFYEAMEDVLPGMKIVIDNGDGVQKVLPLDSFTGNSSENPAETLNTDPAQDTQDLNDSENE